MALLRAYTQWHLRLPCSVLQLGCMHVQLSLAVSDTIFGHDLYWLLDLLTVGVGLVGYTYPHVYHQRCTTYWLVFSLVRHIAYNCELYNKVYLSFCKLPPVAIRLHRLL